MYPVTTVHAEATLHAGAAVNTFPCCSCSLLRLPFMCWARLTPDTLYFSRLLMLLQVVGAPDSGYFFTAGTGYAGWSSALHWVVSAMNSSAGLNQACVRGEAAAQRDPLGCAFPEVRV